MAKYMVQIIGVPELQRKLRTLPTRVQRRLVRGVLREAMRPAQGAIQTATPVGKDAPGHKAGSLRRAIKLRALARSRNKFGVRVTVGEGLFKGRTFYGGMVEYGTKKMSARRFMLTGWRSVESRVAADVQRGLAAAIVEEASATN